MEGEAARFIPGRGNRHANGAWRRKDYGIPFQI